jgi:hypothetical protein
MLEDGYSSLVIHLVCVCMVCMCCMCVCVCVCVCECFYDTWKSQTESWAKQVIPLKTDATMMITTCVTWCPTDAWLSWHIDTSLQSVTC